MKTIALVLFVLGLALVGYSFAKYNTSSFEDGSFLIAVLGIGLGAIIAGLSFIWFFVRLFMGL